jgi:hypothetical protein
MAPAYRKVCACKNSRFLLSAGDASSSGDFTLRSLPVLCPFGQAGIIHYYNC